MYDRIISDFKTKFSNQKLISVTMGYSVKHNCVKLDLSAYTK
jgi:hypothetical protein